MLQVGDIVQSHYASRWFGEVTDVQKRKDCEPLITVRLICTADHRPYHKTLWWQLSAAWLQKVAMPTLRAEKACYGKTQHNLLLKKAQ